MAGIGLPELLIVLAILLLVFGPKRLPGLGRQIGGGLREFKDSVTSRHDAESDDEASTAGLPAGAPPAATPVAGEPVPAAAPREGEQAAPPRG